MGKFSDSPYFLLRGFFGKEGDIPPRRRPTIDYRWPVIWEDRDYVTFDDFGGIVWNLRYYYDPNMPTTDGSYLVGIETNIVAKGDGLVELWVKETEEPHKQFLPITLRFEKIEDNFFIFNDLGICNKAPGNYTRSLTGNHWSFDFFDGQCQGFQNIINQGREVYWRKDSVYHQWLMNQAQRYYPELRGHETDIRNYTNFDKIWNYFGKIYKDYKAIKLQEWGYPVTKVEFRIVFDGLMEYVMRAIPEHQRTTNFDKFCELFFDRKWHEIYNQIKNIWTLVDPMEIDEDYLGYLSIYYHMYDLITPTLFRQREFVRDLIWLLKRKGTYTEYYIIWRTIANTINALNVYEKWHEKQIWKGIHPNYPEFNGDTHVSPGEWQEFIYVEKPEYRFSKPVGGAGKGWYNRYYGLSGESIVDTRPPSAFYNYPVKLDNNWGYDEGYTNLEIDLPMYQIPPEDRVLSTHYKLEIDVSTEPLLPDAIVNEVLWDELWQYWEYLRPVNRVVDYNILIAPITDFSGCFVELYDFGGRAFDKTKVLIDLRTKTGWIDIHTTPDEWYPYCAPSGATYSGALSGMPAGSSPYGGCRWVIKHPLNTKYLHTMATDDLYHQIVPDEIEIVDNNTVIMHWPEPTFGYAVLKKSQTKMFGGSTSSNDWNAYHYRDTNEIVSEVHDVGGLDESNFKVYGDKMDTTDDPAAVFSIENTGDIPLTVVPASSGDFTFYVPSVSGSSAAWIQPIDSPTATWEVPHHLYYRGCICAVYNWDNKQIHQYEFKLTGIDRAVLEFDSPVSGYAVFIPVAQFTLEQLIDDFIDILRNGVDWKAGYEINDLYNDNVAASGWIPQTEIYETDTTYNPDGSVKEYGFVYINVKLGAEISGTFREFAIYNSHGDMIVYSKNSPIYKPAGTTLVLHFRLEKKAENMCLSDGNRLTEPCG